MVHEVPNKEAFFEAMKDVMHDTGEFLIVEPKLFHVSKKEFELTKEKAESIGLKALEGPKLPLSFSAIFKKVQVH